MKPEFKIFKSIFTKLILIVILFGFVINLAVWVFLRFSIDYHPKIVPRYIDRMSEYVIKDVGSPPDTSKIRALTNELMMNVRYQSHDFNYTTSETVPKLEELSSQQEFKDHFPYMNNFAMEIDHRKLEIYKSQNGVFIILPPSPQDFFNPERGVLILVILLTVIFIPLYFLLRALLNPLKILSNTVHQIGTGNYDVQIPFNRKDELGELGNSIKTMAGNIKHAMKSKEQLLIDVSHELRSPLTRIKLGLEVNSSQEKIEEDIREMENMITGLLESYRAETLNFKIKVEKIDLNELLEELKDEYELENRVIFNYPEEKHSFMLGDPSSIKIVLRNLLDNALKYSTGDITLTMCEKENEIIIKVSDKGIGIPENDLEFIFEPFYRSDRSRSRRTGGFGLGLSICKKIVDAHKGKIFVKSKINEGTDFELRFKKAT